MWLQRRKWSCEAWLDDMRSETETKVVLLCNHNLSQDTMLHAQEAVKRTSRLSNCDRLYPADNYYVTWLSSNTLLNTNFSIISHSA